MIIPGADGMFGVLPGHVPTISELKPGVLEVTTAPGEIQKYFISSGFAFAYADSILDVCGIEVHSQCCDSRIAFLPLLLANSSSRRAHGMQPCTQLLLG